MCFLEGRTAIWLHSSWDALPRYKNMPTSFAFFTPGTQLSLKSSHLPFLSWGRRQNTSRLRLVSGNIENIFVFLDSPVFEVTPQDVTGNLNDKVRLECRVASNPEPSYKWRFNDHYQSSGPFLEFDLTNITGREEDTYIYFPYKGKLNEVFPSFC